MAQIGRAVTSPTASTNATFRAKLDAVNAEINLAAKKGQPITNDMMARRRTANAEWLA